MNLKTLTEIGLNESQAKAYISLIKSGSMTPPELSEMLNMKRTNAYAVLDQLTELGLAVKKDVQKKITYYAGHPLALEKLARKVREDALEHERLVQASMPTLLKYFHSFSDQPGVRFYQGVDGIKEIYSDMLLTKKDIYVFRSAFDQDLMSTEFFINFKKQKARVGIKTHILNPENNLAVWNTDNDEKFMFERTIIPKGLYTANTEISTYGNKTSIISFGDESIGMIIDSVQIALAVQQIYYLAKIGSENCDTRLPQK